MRAVRLLPSLTLSFNKNIFYKVYLYIIHIIVEVFLKKTG